MKRIILKAVSYIMLTIGIIGGLSTIDMIFNGNLAIWILLVICLCGIGGICLSASKGIKYTADFDLESVKAQSSDMIIISQKSEVQHLRKQTKIKICDFYLFILDRLKNTNLLYIKFILTVIAIALIVIAVELSTHLSNLTHVLWRLYQVS